MNYHGILIYRERNRRNWSQEGLCKGICTVSYLSKIENGKAEPSEHILKMLLERLELHSDLQTETEAVKTAEQAYELLFTGYEDEFKELISENISEKYRATSVGLDFLLLEKFVGDKEPLDLALEGCMDIRQLALQRILQKHFAESVGLLPNGYTYWFAGMHTYIIGEYTSALEYLQTGYDLAAKEGAAKMMLNCKLLIGNIYCNRRDISNMLRHYEVAKRLAAALDKKSIFEQLDYNIAAVRMENGEFEDSYNYFSKLKSPDIMSLHKLAICCEKTGRISEALEALARADKMESGYMEKELSDLLCSLVRYRLEHKNYLEHAKYGQLLMECFEQCREKLSMGYVYFHLPWVIEWLKATRQYKKAFELIKDFPDIRNLI